MADARTEEGARRARGFRRYALPGICALMVGAGCERSTRTYPLLPEPGHSVARLIDRLDSAHIESPLLDLDPTSVLKAAAGKPVFHEDFQSASHPARVEGGNCRTVPKPGGAQGAAP